MSKNNRQGVGKCDDPGLRMSKDIRQGTVKYDDPGLVTKARANGEKFRLLCLFSF